MRHTRQYSNKQLQRTIAVLVVLVVASLGVYFLQNSHATSQYESSEAESGNLGGLANKQTDSAASNGSYVQFGGSIPSKILGAYSGFENISGEQSIGAQLGHP